MLHIWRRRLKVTIKGSLLIEIYVEDTTDSKNCGRHLIVKYVGETTFHCNKGIVTNEEDSFDCNKYRGDL